MVLPNDDDEDEEEEELDPPVIDDSGFRPFAAALGDGACPVLEDLHIGTLAERGVLLLAGALKSKAGPPLKDLDLSDQRVTEAGLLALGEALQTGAVGASFESMLLCVGGTDMGEDACVSFFEKLFTPPSSIAEPACCGAVKELTLYGARLSDAGMSRVAAALRRCEGTGALGRLTSLEFRCTQPLFGDEGLASLSEAVAKQCPGLRWLSLRETDVTNDGLRRLVLRLSVEGGDGGDAYAFLPALRRVEVYDSRATPTEQLTRLVAKMNEQRPGGFQLKYKFDDC